MLYIGIMKVITIFCIFVTSIALAEGGEKEDAAKGVQKAILAYPVVKSYKKNLEKAIIRKIPLNKETISVVGGLALSASQGYVDTKVIKRMNIKVVGGNMRPNVRYDFRNNETNATMNINWSFK